MRTELIWAKSCWDDFLLKQQKPCWGFTETLLKFHGNLVEVSQKPCWSFMETLLRFHRNPVEVLMLTESGWDLGKIWAGVIALTARNHTRIDMEFRSDEVWDVKLIKSILAVVKEMKGFSDREIIFPINIVFEKWRTVSFIKLGIQDVVDISSSIAIFSNNRLLRFLSLIR